MEKNKQDEKKKDEILQEIYDELERQDWGGNYDRTALRVVFSGRFNLQPIEVEKKQKRKCFL